MAKKAKISVSLDHDVVADMNQLYKNDGPCPSRLLNKLAKRYFRRNKAKGEGK